MKLFITFFTLLMAGFTQACSFAPDADIFKSAEENYSSYPQVLAVTVSSVTEPNENLDRQYVLRVHGNYKGTDQKEIVLSAAGHSCGFFGSAGQNFLWMTKDLDEISEGTPKYFYDSVGKMLQENNDRFGKSVLLPNKACTKEYRPVCADLTVQCVQAPCYPIRQTYSNNCVAESQNAVVVAQGACTYEGPVKLVEENTEPVFDPTQGNGGVIGPQSGPLENFIEPTTPPPVTVNNEEKEEQTDSWFKNMWVTISTWISGLFAN